MESKEEAEKQLSKYALYSGETPAAPLIFNPISRAKKLPSNGAIKKQIFKRFDEENYSGLEQDLKSYGLNKGDIENFFRSKEGFSVIYSSIVAVTDNAPLEFIVNKFIKEGLAMEILQDILRKDNYYVLRTFLMGESGLEESGKYNEELGELQVELFKLLLAIDPKGVREFMQDANNKKYITKTISINFEQATSDLRSPLPKHS